MWDRLMYDTAKVNSHSHNHSHSLSSMNDGREALFCLPDVSNMLGTRKEVEFFGRSTCNKPTGLEQYKRAFPTQMQAGTRVPCRYIDATPYVGSHGGAETALLTAFQVYYSYGVEDLRELRVLAVLREPVSRLLSWYNHLRSYVTAGRCKTEADCNNWICSVARHCVEYRANLLPKKFGHLLIKKHEKSGIRQVCAHSPFDVDAKWRKCFSVERQHGPLISLEAYLFFNPAILLSGLYGPALTIWRSYLGDALKVWPYSEVRDDPIPTYTDILQHITGGHLFEVNASTLSRRDNTHVNRGNPDYHSSCETMKATAPCSLRAQLSTFYARHNDVLVRDYPHLWSVRNETTDDC